MKKTKTHETTVPQPLIAFRAPGEIKVVALDLVRADPNQPRKHFDLAGLESLAESIREQGILQPPLVRFAPAWIIREPDLLTPEWYTLVDETGQGIEEGPLNLCQMTRDAQGRDKDGYVIIDGERRFRAAELAGLKEIPVNVTRLEEHQVLMAQLTSNQARENLTALEEAAGYRKMLDAGTHTTGTLHAALGISRSTLFNRLALNHLTDTVRDALVSGKISTSVASAISMVPGEKLQGNLLKRITEDRWRGELSYRDVMEMIDQDYSKPLRGCAWKLEDADLVPAAGACEACPKRTGNMMEDFPDLKNPQVCTDPNCYRAKLDAVTARKVAVAKEDGRKVLAGGQVYDKYNIKNDYLELSSGCEPLGYASQKTWRSALGKQCPTPTLVVNKEGMLVEVLKRDEAMKAFKAAGLKPKETSYERQYAKEQAKRKEEEKLRKAECNAVSAAMVAKAEQLTVSEPEDFWRALAKGAAHVAGYYILDPVLKRRGIEFKQGYSNEAVAKAAEAMTAQQLVGLMVELLVGQDEDRTNDMGKTLGVNVEKVAKEARAFHVEQKKTPPKNSKTSAIHTKKTKGTK